MKWYAIISPTALIERKLYSHNDDQTGIQIKFAIILLHRTQHSELAIGNAAKAFLLKEIS